MKHVYEFPVSMTFTAREGYFSISVVDGRLELDSKPDPGTLALIEKHGGELVKDDPKPKKEGTKKRKATPIRWSESEEVD